MTLLKKIASLVFHRTALVVVLMLVQIAVLAVAVVRFSDYFVYFYALCVVLSVLVVLRIVSTRSDPGYKIAWIIPILLVPVFGGLVYLLFGGNRMSGRLRRKMESAHRKFGDMAEADCRAEELLAPYGQDAVNQARYLERYAQCPPYENTAAKYYPLGDDVWEDMLEVLRGAERYIFLEYFIIEPGEFWDSIVAVLEEKAAAGVEVRLIYDDVGSLYTLPKDYDRTMEAKGVHCKVFNRFIPVLSARLNNRDHRKFLIVDGKVGFTGGINMADEYVNLRVKYGHWKDSAIRLTGEGVWSMTMMFLAMWSYMSGKEEDFASFWPASLPEEAKGVDGVVQPYWDSPLDGEPVGETVYLNLINKAGKYVYITTPYLIISDNVNTALCAAAKAGVDVRIMTPHVPDKRTIFEVTQAHYEPLLEAGVRIYEYTPGFVHAKNFAVDDKYATVGTVNMDYRSMFLHFENGVLLYETPSVADIREDFLDTQTKSLMVTLEDCRSTSIFRRTLRDLLRLFSPLL